jgi:hypothetical protein
VLYGITSNFVLFYLVFTFRSWIITSEFDHTFFEKENLITLTCSLIYILISSQFVINNFRKNCRQSLLFYKNLQIIERIGLSRSHINYTSVLNVVQPTLESLWLIYEA